jgi:hypothetical protein
LRHGVDITTNSASFNPRYQWDLLTFPWVGSWPFRDLPSGPRECAGQVSDLPFRLPSGRAEARGSRVAEGYREATRSALDARGVRP